MRFSTPHLVELDAASSDYLHTRAIARAIFAKANQTEAFFYPSVRQEAGMNFVVKADTYALKMHIVASQVVKIIRHRKELGLFDYEICRHATRVNDDGKFEWSIKEEDLASRAVMFGMTNREADFAKVRNNTLRGNDYIDIVRLTPPSDD